MQDSKQDSNSLKPKSKSRAAAKSYKLTSAERALLQSHAEAIDKAKLQVYAGNVALEDLRARVAAAVAAVERAEVQFATAREAIAKLHRIERGRISRDLSTIDPE